MTNVTGFKGNPPPLQDCEVDKEIINKLKDLIEMANSGHLKSFAFCTYDSNGMIGTGWEAGNEAFKLGAAISAIQYRYSKRLWDGIN